MRAQCKTLSNSVTNGGEELQKSDALYNSAAERNSVSRQVTRHRCQLVPGHVSPSHDVTPLSRILISAARTRALDHSIHVTPALQLMLTTHATKTYVSPGFHRQSPGLL